MKTYFDKKLQKWVSNKPTNYWSGMICSETGEKIYTGDKYQVLNAAGWNEPITLTCCDSLSNSANTYYSSKMLKYKLLK